MEKELVICRYRESLSWLHGITIPIIVYNKSNSEYDVPVNATVTRERNVGREAHVILKHIVSRWDDLADVTFFAQGKVDDLSPDFSARLRHSYEAPTALSTQYPNHNFPAAISNLVKGHVVAYGNAQHYSGGGADVEKWINEIWNIMFDCPIPEDFIFGFGALWAVPRYSIQDRPWKFWNHWLYDIETTKSGNVYWRKCPPYMNAWSWELVWKYVFESPIKYPHKIIRD